MTQMVFINLAVDDLERAKIFFTELGFLINDQFTDETAASVVISDAIYVMLLTRPKMGQFTDKHVADTSTTTEVIVALSADSRTKVDELVDRAIELGARAHREPDELDFMYSRSFEDLDGHLWEVVWMNPDAMAPHPA